jgi:recombination protein RecA
LARAQVGLLEHYMSMATKKKQTTAAAHDDIRAGALESFLGQMSKDKPGEVRALSDESALRVEVIPTGVISLDVALGIGGLPKGRVTEIYGPTGGGKSTLSLAVAIQCQKLGGNVGFVDCEQALSKELAMNMGVDPDKFVVYQPKDGEDAIDMVESMLKSRAFDLVIVDSIAAMTPRAEMEADIQQQHMGLHARLMSKFMRRVYSPVSDANVVLLCLNQVRVNLQSYGAPERPTGGNAVAFAASIRVEVRTSPSKKIEREGVAIGTLVTAKVLKNKLASPYRQAEYDVIFGRGIEASGSLLAVCEQLGLVVRNGASYMDATTGERLGIGKDNVKRLLNEDKALYTRLEKAVYDTVEANRVGGVKVEESKDDHGSDGYESLETELVSLDDTDLS